jgi:hypothetical protein
MLRILLLVMITTSVSAQDKLFLATGTKELKQKTYSVDATTVIKWTIPNTDSARYFISKDGTPLIAVLTFQKASVPIPTTKIEAESYVERVGTGTEPILGGGTAVCCNYKGNYLKYNIPQTTVTKLSLNVSRGNTGDSSVEIRTTSRTGPIVATVTIPRTGTVWNTGYVTVNAIIPTIFSTSTLFITFDNAVPADGRCNIDWLSIN